MLEVKKDQGAIKVSCRLDRAPLDVVIRKLLKDAEVSFLYERAGPTGRVTASFQNQNLSQALNILLEPFEYQAIQSGNVYVIRAIPIGWKPPAPPVAPSAPQPSAAPAAATPPVSAPISMVSTPMPGATPGMSSSEPSMAPTDLPVAGTQSPPQSLPNSLPVPAGETPKTGVEPVYASSDATEDIISLLTEDEGTGITYRVVTPLYVPASYILTNILTNLYPTGGSNSLQYGIVPETNQIFLYGSVKEVSRAVRIIRDADIEPVHIYFETALVAFTSEVSEIVGSALLDLANKQYSGVNVIPGYPNAPAIAQPGTFTFVRDSLQDNPLSFQALINTLVSINQARVLARPYLFTLNGQQATLNVGDQGYVQVKNAQSAQGTTTSSNQITVGTTLTVTPTALPDGTIRLAMQITQSQLIAQSAQLDAETDNASASTVLQVRDGESVLIGGLNSQESDLLSYGFPYLEKIPLLNFLFKSIFNTYFQQQVFIYITPRIWRPSLETPVEPRPEVPFQSRLDALNRPYE
jgi:type II secretory pathway component GspD/PulD (secretin)